jgi:hypothetical protein
MLPTFFIAGVPKAGTTSLHSYLGEHPEIFMSAVKEPHYFSWEDDGWPRWAVREREAYEALFAAARPGQQRGESSTWTLYSEGAPRRIAEAVPRARIIALLRDPSDRAFSNWAFNFGLGYDPIEPFETALAAEPGRIERGSAWHHHYTAAGFYYEQVRRYLEVFDRGQVLIMLFEELREDTHAAVERAYEFLGVDPSFRPDIEAVHNPTYVPRSRRLHNFLWRSSPVKSALKKALPFGLNTFFGKQLRTRNRTASPKLAPETRHRLNELFRDDVSKLSELLGRDLSKVWLR